MNFNNMKLKELKKNEFQQELIDQLLFYFKACILFTVHVMARLTKLSYFLRRSVLESSSRDGGPKLSTAVVVVNGAAAATAAVTEGTVPIAMLESSSSSNFGLSKTGALFRARTSSSRCLNSLPLL